MKNIIIRAFTASILLGTFAFGCGESKETKENIAKQTRLMEQEAAARKKAEDEKQKELDEAQRLNEKIANERRERINNTYGNK